MANAGTGGGLGFDLSQRVSIGINGDFVSIITVTAGTGIGSITLLSTGGSSGLSGYIATVMFSCPSQVSSGVPESI